MKYFLFNLKHSLASFFAYLTFPKECSLCGKIAYAMPLCVNCEKKLISEKITNRCKSCGKELFFEKDFCIKCRQKERFFENCESVYPIFSYVLQKKKLLYMWKVANHREMVFFFGKVCFPIFQERFKNMKETFNQVSSGELIGEKKTEDEVKEEKEEKLLDISTGEVENE